jgi:endonuclease/exonuclease/phosphatase family metal-dependent hydrolase
MKNLAPLRLCAKSFLAVLSVLFLLPETPAIAQTAETGKELKILSWNIYMLPRFALHTGKRKRAREIAKMLPAENYDIMVFQEAFHGDARRIIKRKLKKLYPYRVGPANRRVFWIKTNSGVWMLSKVPLKKLKQIKYKDCDGFTDCFAHKGALLVEGEWEGQKFQLLGTHIQAGGPYPVRQSQYEQIRGLIDTYKQEGVPQLLAGDFNMGIDRGDPYYQMLKTLDVEEYVPDSELKYTASTLNDIRGGDDDRLIDFIFYRPNGTQPKQLIRNVRRFATIQPCFKKYCDLSDHFGVEAIIRFK